VGSFPEIVTHNFDPARGAFRNLCDLSHAEAQAVLDDISHSGLRSIKPDYLERRLRTEDWLLQESRRKLGLLPLERPVYFFLGDMADGLDPSRPRSIVIPINSLPAEALTFTFPDSMASLPIATREELAVYRKPYHGQVFTLDEIAAVVAEFGLPDPRSGDPARRFDRFIEVQLWDDQPVRRLVT